MEGGGHRKRARAWDAGDEPIAVALLGDMTIGLSQTKSAPAGIDIDAYALFRMPACSSPRAPTSRCPAASFEVTWATRTRRIR
jgi:hypothetical protein